MPSIVISFQFLWLTFIFHGYAILEDSLPKNMKVSHRNWNDMTIEGIRYLDHNSFTVQFHPEASPGPRDTGYLFDEFMKIVSA